VPALPGTSDPLIGAPKPYAKGRANGEIPTMTITLKRLVAGDEAVLDNVAPGVFDEPVRPDLKRRFLATANYRIVVALDGDLVVGMATGFTHFHPDKDEEFFVNELGVDDAYRRQGIGERLMRAILAEAKAMGCADAWLGTEHVNAPALGLYRKLMTAADTEEAMSVFTYDLKDR
jgi:aminoglycoside 6'-N-acetyltransferase I